MYYFSWIRQDLLIHLRRPNGALKAHITAPPSHSCPRWSILHNAIYCRQNINNITCFAATFKLYIRGIVKALLCVTVTSQLAKIGPPQPATPHKNDVAPPHNPVNSPFSKPSL